MRSDRCALSRRCFSKEDRGRLVGYRQTLYDLRKGRVISNESEVLSEAVSEGCWCESFTNGRLDVRNFLEIFKSSTNHSSLSIAKPYLLACLGAAHDGAVAYSLTLNIHITIDLYASHLSAETVN